MGVGETASSVMASLVAIAFYLAMLIAPWSTDGLSLDKLPLSVWLIVVLTICLATLLGAQLINGAVNLPPVYGNELSGGVIAIGVLFLLPAVSALSAFGWNLYKGKY